MSETQQVQKPTSTKAAIKAKNDKETRVQAQQHLENAATHSSNLESEELLSGELSQILKPPPSGVLGREASSILQPQTAAGQASARAVSSFSGKNFSGIPTRNTVQAKLTVGAAHDPYEKEADQVADQVMRRPTLDSAASNGAAASEQRGPAIQRTAEEDELQAKPLAASISQFVQRALPAHDDEDVPRAAEEDVEIQTKRASAADSFEGGDDFEGRVAATRGGGTPLPAEVRTFMEPRFGADFSGVRVHADEESAELNRAVSAQAFTLGHDVYFGKGKTDLSSESGKHLLAHELTHVVQQTGNQLPQGYMQRDSTTVGDVTYYSTRAEAEAAVPAHVSPSECFVWNDGPRNFPWRPIPGTGCAHWVAHEKGLSDTPGCFVGNAIRVSQVTAGLTAYDLAHAQADDIWTNTAGSHCGIVRSLNQDATGNVLSAHVEHCSSGSGGVVTSDFQSGQFYR
jgi:hypothetical protein